VRVDAVTTRYAEALFGLARRKGVLKEVQADVSRISHEVSVPAVAEFLFNPMVGQKEKRQSLNALASTFHELTSNLVQLLLDKRREDVLRDLATAFRRRVLTESGAVEGVVESARPLNEADLKDLASTLGTRLGKEVLLESRTVPDLVGGVRVIVNNRMIDYSVQGRISDLRKRMLDSQLPSAGA
jgi:F-type H+-transporting ATPase subunit delta